MFLALKVADASPRSVEGDGLGSMSKWVPTHKKVKSPPSSSAHLGGYTTQGIQSLHRLRDGTSRKQRPRETRHLCVFSDYGLDCAWGNAMISRF